MPFPESVPESIAESIAETAPAPAPSSTLRRGLIMMVLGIIAFTAMDAVAKALVAHYPTAQIVWARFVGQLLFVTLLLGRNLPQGLRTRYPGWHVARAVSQMGTTILFFTSLKFVGLAEATALADLNPVLITLGAALFLGERLGRARLIGVGAALVGALIILRPGVGVFSPGAILPLCCAFTYAANILLTRHIGPKEGPSAAMFYAAALGVGLSSLVLPWVWVPIAPGDLPLFGLLTMLGAAAQYCIIKAYSQVEAAVVAPFGYLDVVGAGLWGALIFDELPDRFTLLGALVIVLAGLYVWRHETVAAQRAAAKG